MDNDSRINEKRKRIEEKMNELKIFDYNTLLIFASVIALELQDKVLNSEFPKGFDYEAYAAKMLIKGAHLAQEFHAKKNAAMRHKETYELKKQAIEYWRAHIDSKLSNPKAADLLIKIVPVSHRKLVEYVAEAKRENIHPAS